MIQGSLSMVATFDDESTLLCKSHQEPKRDEAPINESLAMLNLAVPTMIIQLGSTLPGFLTASYVGRSFGPVYLDAYTLSMLTANLCNLTLLSGLYSASDTLSPRAYAAGNYREVGLLAVRGYATSLCLLVPINVALVFLFGPIMTAVGVHEDVATAAHEWYQVYAFGLPFYSAYLATWKFLSSQSVMRPLLIVSTLCIGLVFPIVFYTFTTLSGFLGSAVAVVVYMIFQIALLMAYLAWKSPHTPGTWPGLTSTSLRDALDWVSARTYVMLGMGGIIATSEWVYWEALSLMIGTLGVTELSVHAIPTQLVLIGFMPSFGVAQALSVRLGATIPYDVSKAKRLAWTTMGCSTVGFVAIGTWVYLDRARIFAIFTSDEDVLAGAEEIWWKVSIFYVNLCIFGINIGISSGLGMQWLFGAVTVFFLWCISLPLLYYFAIFQRGGLDVAWSCIVPPYTAMNLYLAYKFYTADWQAIQDEIRYKQGTEARIAASTASGKETNLLV